MNLNFKLDLKVSAFYLEKQKSLIPKKKFLSRTAKIDLKDGISRLTFSQGFGHVNQGICVDLLLLTRPDFSKCRDKNHYRKVH